MELEKTYVTRKRAEHVTEESRTGYKEERKTCYRGESIGGGYRKES